MPNNRSGVDWTVRAPDDFARILESLEERLLPGLRDSIVTSRLLTPDDFEHTMRSPDGAAFGPEPLFTQSAWFRHHNASDDVRGLYFVGAGTHPGAGVPGVLNSPKVVDQVVPAPAHRRSAIMPADAFATTPNRRGRGARAGTDRSTPGPADTSPRNGRSTRAARR